jgi:transposase
MGRQEEPAQLFYKFSLDRHVPADHLLRQIDAVLDLSTIRRRLAPYYAVGGRPSIAPELMIRMLLVGYVFAIRSERRLCEEVQSLGRSVSRRQMATHMAMDGRASMI